MDENKQGFKLKFPITGPLNEAGEPTEITEIILPKRIKAKHLKQIPFKLLEGLETEFEFDKIIPIISILSGTPEICFDEIDLVDLEVIIRESNLFHLLAGANGKK